MDYASFLFWSKSRPKRSSEYVTGCRLVLLFFRPTTFCDSSDNSNSVSRFEFRTLIDILDVPLQNEKGAPVATNNNKIGLNADLNKRWIQFFLMTHLRRNGNRIKRSFKIIHENQIGVPVDLIQVLSSLSATTYGHISRVSVQRLVPQNKSYWMITD